MTDRPQLCIITTPPNLHVAYAANIKNDAKSRPAWMLKLILPTLPEYVPPIHGLKKADHPELSQSKTGRPPLVQLHRQTTVHTVS